MSQVRLATILTPGSLNTTRHDEATADVRLRSAALGGTPSGTLGRLTLGTAGTTGGTMLMAGSTSGVVTVQPTAAGTTWALTLPDTGGTNGFVLQTDGAGVTSWVSNGITINTTDITSGTANRLLFESATNKVTESANLTYDGTTLTYSSAGTTQTTAQFNQTALTTGTGLQVNSTNAAQTGNSFLVNSNSTGAVVGGLVRFTFSGAHTNQGFLISDVATTGTVMQINPTALTTGSALTINGTNAAQTGTGLLVTSNSTGVVVNGLARFNFTGAHSGNGVQINDATATGTAMRITTTALSSGKALDIVGTGTAAAANTQTMLNISTSGANATATQTTYGAIISNTHTGTTSTNVALQATASGGTTNIAVDSVGLLQTTAFKLSTAPTAGFVLGSDASGNGTWVSPTGTGMVIGGTVTSGTTEDILFVGAGPVLAQDNKFKWDTANFRINITAPTVGGDYIATNVIGSANVGATDASYYYLQNGGSGTAYYGVVSTGWTAGVRGADANYGSIHTPNGLALSTYASELRLSFSDSTVLAVNSTATMYMPAARFFGIGAAPTTTAAEGNLQQYSIANGGKIGISIAQNPAVAGVADYVSFAAIVNGSTAANVRAQFGAVGNTWTAGTNGADANYGLVQAPLGLALNVDAGELRLSYDGSKVLAVNSTATMYMPAARFFGIGAAPTTTAAEGNLQQYSIANGGKIGISIAQNPVAPGATDYVSFAAIVNGSTAANVKAQYGAVGSAWTAGTNGANANYGLVQAPLGLALNVDAGELRLSYNGSKVLIVDAFDTMYMPAARFFGIGAAPATASSNGNLQQYTADTGGKVGISIAQNPVSPTNADYVYFSAIVNGNTPANQRAQFGAVGSAWTTGNFGADASYGLIHTPVGLSIHTVAAGQIRLAVDSLVQQTISSTGTVFSNDLTMAAGADLVMSNTSNLSFLGTATVQNQSGSVSLPSYTFSGDTDTGLFHPAANKISLTVGSTEILRGRTDGVGQVLIIDGNVTNPGLATLGDEDTGLYVDIGNTLSVAAGGNAIAHFIWTGSHARLSLQDGGTVTVPSLYLAGNNNTGLYSPATNVLSITNNSVEALRCDSTSYVRIAQPGSNATPSLYWETDTDTGIWHSGADSLTIAAGGKANIVFTPYQTDIGQGVAATSGSPYVLQVTGAAHTTLASAEAPDVIFNLARTVQFSAGALTSQRAVNILAPTYAFTGSSTLSDAATVSITGAPIAGTNATITRSTALWLRGGAVASGVASSYGLYVDVGTGATNNYSAAFTSGNVGIGTITPATTLDVDGDLATRAVTPSSFTGTQHNFAIAANSFARLSGSSTPVITGIASNNQDGKRLVIRNIGATAIQFNNQDAGSTAANRIITGTGANVTLAVDASMEMIYDATTARWCKLG